MKDLSSVPGRSSTGGIEDDVQLHTHPALGHVNGPEFSGESFVKFIRNI